MNPNTRISHYIGTYTTIMYTNIISMLYTKHCTADRKSVV